MLKEIIKLQHTKYYNTSFERKLPTGIIIKMEKVILSVQKTLEMSALT